MGQKINNIKSNYALKVKKNFLTFCRVTMLRIMVGCDCVLFSSRERTEKYAIWQLYFGKKHTLAT